jgi:hypothetical protein
MSAWIEGLLGAVMGGAKSVEESIKEEEAARRKEEEEKRREQRLLTIEERKEKNAIEKERRLAEQKKAEEEQGRQRVAGYMAPQEQVGVSQSPMEPEGMVTREMKGGDLNTAINRAMSEGRLDVAKSLSEELNRQIKRDIDLRETAIKEEKAERPEKEKLPERAENVNFLTKEFYKGGFEDGKPTDPQAYAEARKRATDRVFGESRVAATGGTAAPKPATGGQLIQAQKDLAKDIRESFATGTGKDKKIPGFVVDRAEKVARDILKGSDPADFDYLSIKNEAVSKVRNAQRSAEKEAGAAWDALPPKERKASRKKFVEDNYESYIDKYLTSGSQPKSREGWSMERVR